MLVQQVTSLSLHHRKTFTYTTDFEDVIAGRYLANIHSVAGAAGWYAVVEEGFALLIVNNQWQLFILSGEFKMQA